jgi:stage V sporulation protein B
MDDQLMSKNSILKGTLILTIAGLLTRLLGFFYKIYLSNTLGAENLGIYQLIFPIYGICFTLYAAGIQTSISQLIAAESGKRQQLFLCSGQTKVPNNYKRILFTGIFCSLLIAFCLSFFVYTNAEKIATTIIMEPSCTGPIRILAYIFPFCGITSCINGYYYGLKKASVPAATQLVEQIVRVISVYVIATYIGNGEVGMTCELAVFGIVLGEIASNIYNIVSFKVIKPAYTKATEFKDKYFVIVKKIAKLSLPLTGNRLVLSILHGFETILIPAMLKKSGLSNAETLSVYGVLTGMAIPFILFPSTITNSLSVLLLPTVSEAQAVNNNRMIERTTATSIKYSLLIGLLSTAVFIIFGNSLGLIIFHNKSAGAFLVTLSWLCPFLYLSTTLSSIINGLGKTHLTFFNTIIGLGLRILFIVYLIPAKGIIGYLIGLLVSQLSIALLDYMAISGSIKVELNAIDWILKPSLILVFVGFLVMKTYEFLCNSLTISPLLLLFMCCIILSICYIGLLLIVKTISIKDMK